jgi:riboflavin kinase/FMN adenylyltransferase
VVNIGTRPTVEGSHITIEPWILDFSGDLYEKELTLALYAFLRPEKKFPNLVALQQEILRNAEETRQYFKTHPI